MKKNNSEGWTSIVYYKRWAEMLIGMPAELRHKIHDAIDEYIVSQVDPVDQAILYSPYYSIKQQINHDKELYEERIIKRNRRNGNKGGRPKKNPDNPENPLGLQKPKKPDNDNYNYNDNISLLNKESLRESSKGIKFDSQSIKQQLLSDESWKESVCMQSTLGLAFMAILSEQIDKFIAYIVSIGEEQTISNLSDAKRRFTYWWQNHGRKEVQNENKQEYIIPD